MITTGIGYTCHRSRRSSASSWGGSTRAERGLAGHDADVLNAFGDSRALVRRLGGHRPHFPDTDERYRERRLAGAAAGERSSC